MASEFILVKDAADYLDVSTRTIQRYIKSKKVKFKNINGKVLINKDSLEAFKEVSDIAKKDDSKKINDGSNNKSSAAIGFDWQFIKDSLEILRDQLRSKDDQIKVLTDSVKELQSTQKLLIERGMNLRQLPEELTHEDKNNSLDTKISIDQADHQPKVINVQIKNPDQSNLSNEAASTLTINPIKKKNTYIMPMIISAIAILVLAALFMLYKLSVRTPY